MKEPKIRFNEFKGEWEETTFGESVIINSGLDYKHLSDGDIPVYGTGGYMLSVNQSLSEVDAIGIGRKGTIDKPQFLKAPFWTVDTLFFMTPKKGLDLHFLFALSQKTNWRKFDESTGVPSLSKINICKIDIFTPKISEQHSIASFFTTLDAQISASTSRLASLKQIKAASLQAMFPQEGETVPKLRFKGFEGEWEKVKLGELFSERLERSDIGEMLSVTMNNGIIKAADNGRFDNSSEDKSNYKVVKVGDIAYNTMRMWQGACGCSLYKGIVSPAYTVVVPNDGVYSSFFAYYFKTQSMINLFRLNSQGLTKDTWNLKYNVFKLIELLSPNNIAEQRAIASYFTNLDRQITLQSQRLEKLKQIKAACLDKMFV